MAGRRLTIEERAALDAVARLPEQEIDTSDAPEIRNFSHALRGSLYRPMKQQLTLKLDADLVQWFKRHAIDGREAPERGYQTRINHALRLYVQDHDPEFGQSLERARPPAASAG